MANEVDIKTKAVEIIRNYIGDVMARSYADFYQQKDDELVIDSVNALLEEYVGALQAKEILAKNGLTKTKL
jgi:hypothetical protein